MTADNSIAGSFRDPSGFLFFSDGCLYRQVNASYRSHYDHLMESGLYRDVTEQGLLVPHTEASLELAQSDSAYKIIRPVPIPFISYPYEWCFSEMKDAALATLEIQKIAFQHGMTLKDASAYNIQFLHGKPVFIDTLSFETYRPGQIWTPYRQFCQHFLAPLALMSCRDIRLNQLLRIHMDGIPLDLASSLLPRSTWLRFSLLSHLHLHAKSQRWYADKPIKARETRMSQIGFQGMIDSLENAVRRLTWRPEGTEWGDYYHQTNYSDLAMKDKEKKVAACLEQAKPATVWDLGANTGAFSRIAASLGANTVSFDIDPAAVEIQYRQLSSQGDTHILPLLLDLNNPSAGIGWACEERLSLLQRGPADAVLALALVHHLAISNNLPLERIARFLAGICRWLIIEFVPKEDSQVQRLLASREDIFPSYTREHFESAFQTCFTLCSSSPIDQTQRTLYLMKTHSPGTSPAMGTS